MYLRSIMENLIIIGAGSAGVAAAEAARKQNENISILLFSEESQLPYHRIRLFKVAEDTSQESKITLHPASWYEERKIDLRLNTKIIEVDDEKKEVITKKGERFSFDKLILATGSKAFLPPIKNVEAKGVHTIWTMGNILDLEEELASVKDLVVIGGGLLGLEAAYSLSQKNCHVTVLQRGNRLLSRQLDEKGSELYLKKTKTLGIDVLFQADTKEILSDENGRVKEILLESGQRIPCQLVLVSAGVRPRLELLEKCGCQAEVCRQIVVNKRMETSLPHVYACGDNALVDNQWYGLWMISKNEGEVAGTNAAGGNASYTMPSVPYSMNSMDLPLYSAGSITEEEGIETKTELDEENYIYKKYFYKNGELVGFILLGDTKEGFRLNKTLLAN